MGFGRSYFIGRSKDDAVKVDLHYHDEISDPLEIIDGIRMASIADIIAMKVDVIISRGGRKKDFWDIHELLNTYPIHEMLQFQDVYKRQALKEGRSLSQLTPTMTSGNIILPIILLG